MTVPAQPRQDDVRRRIFCAIDTPDLARAEALARALGGAGCGIKLGLEFFAAQGPDGVRRVTAVAEGAALFLDLKFHDIPNTVAAAVRAAAPLGPRIVNVHAAGGRVMMEAARDAAREGAERAGAAAPLVIAVTVLTSLDTRDLSQAGVIGSAEEQAVRLATLAHDAGLDGVVCSAHEIPALRRALGPDFVLVTPGIRPAGAEAADQKRVMTPGAALAAGADYLVIGRPITGAADPARAVAEIAREAADEGVPR